MGIDRLWRPNILFKNHIPLPRHSIGTLLKDRRVAGIAALTVGMFFWGVTPVILRRLTQFIDPWTTNAIRYPMAAMLYWPLLFYMRRSGKLTKDLLKRCIVPALFSLGGQVFWALAHYELQASEVGFFVRTSTAWAILGAMILFDDERRLLYQPRFYYGLVLILIGFLAMSLLGGNAEKEGLLVDGNYSLGVIYVLLASTFFGFYIVSIRYFVPNVNPMHAFGIVCQIVSVGVIVGLFAFGHVQAIGQQSAFSWSLLVSSTLLGIAFGHVLMYTAIQRLGASITSSCQSLLPFVTVSAAHLALGENLGAWQWRGGLLMVVGAIVLLSVKNAPRGKAD